MLTKLPNPIFSFRFIQKIRLRFKSCERNEYKIRIRNNNNDPRFSTSHNNHNITDNVNATQTNLTQSIGSRGGAYTVHSCVVLKGTSDMS